MNNSLCPHCSGSADLLLQTKDFNRRISNDSFNYFRCNICHFVFLNPVPVDLYRYYPPAYYDIPKTHKELSLRANKLQLWKINLVKLYAPGRGRLLEIGPAYGLFAFLAKEAGYDVTAIEMDSQCSKFLRETVQINVVESPDTIRSLSKLPKFDVIVMWQVIEHLTDPWSLLSEACSHLNPGGILILDTPNPNAFQFRVLGRFWTHIDAPRHVCLLSASGLIEHMRKNSMDPILLSATNAGSIGFNGFGWAHTFKNFFRNDQLGTMAHLIGRVIAKLLIPFERTGWRGSTYTAVFRREDK